MHVAKVDALNEDDKGAVRYFFPQVCRGNNCTISLSLPLAMPQFIGLEVLLLPENTAIGSMSPDELGTDFMVEPVNSGLVKPDPPAMNWKMQPLLRVTLNVVSAGQNLLVIGIECISTTVLSYFEIT